MRFRKLRIAWSLFWGIACVLLIALWVRSYSWWDELYTPLSIQRYYETEADGRLIVIESASGQVIVTFSTGSGPWIWHIASKLTDRYPYGPHSELADQHHTTGLAGFAIYRAYGLNPTVCVPHWFLALAFVGLGGLSWLHWQKRFSLRTLLIATTLVAVVLGLAV
jgi:hypothetical protein